jgi:hypothetical protein
MGSHLNLSRSLPRVSPLRTGCPVLNIRHPPFFIVDRMLKTVYKGRMFEEPPPSIPCDPPGASGTMRHPAAETLLRSTAAWPSPFSPRLQPTPPSRFRSVHSSPHTPRKFAQSGTKTSLRPIPIEPELIRPNQTSIFFRFPSLAFFPRSHASLCLPTPAHARPATPKTAPFPVRPFNRPQCQSLHGLVSSPFKVIQAG